MGIPIVEENVWRFFVQKNNWIWYCYAKEFVSRQARESFVITTGTKLASAPKVGVCRFEPENMDCRFSKAILRDICNKFIDVYLLDLYRCHVSQFSSRLPDYISISTVYLSMKLLSTTAGLYHSSSLPKLFLPQQMSIIADCTKFVSSTVYLYQNPSLIPNLYNSTVTLTNLYKTYLYQMKCIFTKLMPPQLNMSLS